MNYRLFSFIQKIRKSRPKEIQFLMELKAQRNPTLKKQQTKHAHKHTQNKIQKVQIKRRKPGREKNSVREISSKNNNKKKRQKQFRLFHAT
jgi:hypothetical protein